MQLVPTFGEVQLQILGPAPLAERFVQVQHGEVREVGNPRYSLEGIESGVGSIFAGEKEI